MNHGDNVFVMTPIFQMFSLYDELLMAMVVLWLKAYVSYIEQYI